MENRGGLTKGLAIAGTVLTLFPILTPVVFSLIYFAEVGQYRIDYLMPAELFPAALAGTALLIWAAARARLSRKWIVWSIAAAVLLLVGSQTVAVVTGLASGETEAVGWPWIMVLALLIGFILAEISLFIGAIFLLRDLFTPKR